MWFEEELDQHLKQDWENESLTDRPLERVNSYYGGDSWRTKLDSHIIAVPAGNRLPWIPVVNSPLNGSIAIDLYGTQWRIDEIPMHVVKPVLDKPSLSGYKFLDPDAFFDEGWHERALRFIDENKDHFLLGAVPGGWGLFERSWNMRGFENALMDTVIHPDFYQELIEAILEHQLALLERILPLPLDGFIFSDDYGGQDGIMIGAERWRKYFKANVAKIYAKVHEAGKYVINYMCGSEAEILPDLIDIGLNVYESVQPEAKNNSPYRLKKLHGKDITFWGGIGSQSTIPFGSPSEIKSEVRKMCKEMGKGGGYILSCAKALQPGTPTENAIAIIEAFAKQAGIYI